MVSRSLCGCAVATGEVVCMQPDRASAVMAVMIGSRNARATRTVAIPSSETSVLHRLWLTNGFCWRYARPMFNGRCGRPQPAFHLMRSDQAALTPAPIGHDTPG